MSLEQFLEDARNVHGMFYDYSGVVWVDSSTKVAIRCPVHGIFHQVPSDHKRGRGCSSCSRDRRRLTYPRFLDRAREIHGDRYSYPADLENFTTQSVISIRCTVHGMFDQRASSHLEGYGCPRCSGKGKHTLETIRRKAQEVHHHRYTYDGVRGEWLHIVCPVHGEFVQRVSAHLRGQGCPGCASEDNRTRRRLERATVVSRALEEHDFRYTYGEEYVNYYTPMEITCPDHGVFYQRMENHLRGSMCPSCVRASGASRGETELYEFLVSLKMGEVIRHDRSVLDGQEIDIWIPQRALAIEYCGLYWHGEANRGRGYHYAKMRGLAEKGIRLITLFEDEWVYRNLVTRKVLRHIVGLNDGTMIGARKCLIEEIDSKRAKDFLDTHHLQGHTSATVHLGGIYNGSLVGVMSFGHPTRQYTQGVELKRFALAGSSPGLASRLFRHYISQFSPTRIVSFSDNRWFRGAIYETLGFSFDGEIPPDYWYVRRNQRYHKSGFRKTAIRRSHPEVYRDDLTESEMMTALGYHRIWDCGKVRWVWMIGS